MQYFAYGPLIFVSGETQVIRFETKKELFFQMIYKKYGVGLKFVKKSIILNDLAFLEPPKLRPQNFDMKFRNFSVV